VTSELGAATSSRPSLHHVAVGTRDVQFLLAFRADPRERVAFEERARALGAAIETRSAFTSYLRDPDGNRIAVSEFEVAP
jgi:hypothetical protein